MLADLAMIACLGSTLFMAGVIWFVQVVHYPLFGRVEGPSFGPYHRDHTRLTTYVVFGPMAVELATSVILVADRPAGVGPWLAWLGLASAVVSWGSTGLMQVPCHDRLARGYCAETQRRLVRSNWLRVASWSAHAAIVLGMTLARIGR